MEEPPAILDPVAAYDRLAPVFAGVAQRRSRYLQRIEDLIVARADRAQSLLDVGAGDGGRASRIAEKLRLERVVLLEPSAEMSRRVGGHAEVWRVRAEALDANDAQVAGRRFDLVTCLWNVLGHIRPERARAMSLQQMGALLAHEGRLFVDVNHRYNVRSYGILSTLSRLIRDRASPGEERGDVTVRWHVGEERVSTYGHVFTDREMRRLAARAGLVVEERIVVDYDTGQTRRWAWLGNLLYVLARAPAVTRV
jgi:SAM-dependent methyltransferase